MGDGGVGTALRFRDFRYIWFADLASIAGDQLARVALAVLVYGRTRSALAATVTYALTFLPALLGGVLLSWVADRFRRREVMVVTDLLRAVLVAAMAIPGLSLLVVCGLLVIVVLLGSPFTAARSALLPDVLPGDHYERGLALVQITGQSAQLAGFAGGGLLVAALSPPVALLGNAGTFLLSAALVRFGVADRPAPAATADRREGGTVAVLGAIAGDRRRRALVLLAWLVGWYVVPESLAAPYADQLGAGPAAVGVLMAADPLGSVLGAWLFTRFVPAPVRGRLVGVLAVGAGLPLVACVFRPDLPVTLVLWGLSGMLATAYLVQTQAEFVRATVETERGRAVGVAAAGIIAAQGLAVLAGGLLAEWTDPATAIAIAGSAGVLLCGAVAVAWHRATTA
ncbi:MFS transporter [Actinophytocola gossypii]|uniref:MFS transporter n=1 Tax=Actinophytocola gossypii TaxID=2812003 RepID=A0ABT2J119_9PSEU|nr:MFS transporter [Actinophytocola gossypii]MCT2581555.1 MFS transporter [Actinophytocola gossypii]